MRRQTLVTFLLWYNGAQVVAWACLIGPTLLWWSQSILWIALMSVWANFAAAVAGLTAALISREVSDQT